MSRAFCKKAKYFLCTFLRAGFRNTITTSLIIESLHAAIAFVSSETLWIIQELSQIPNRIQTLYKERKCMAFCSFLIM